MTDKQKIARLKHYIYQYRSDVASLKYYEDMNYYGQVSYDVVKDHSSGSQLYFMNERLDKMAELHNRIRMIEQAYEAIGAEAARIIHKDFYEEEKFWWMDYYSRATYYRRRKEAITAFLNYMNDIIVFS